jgi:acyl-CoA synthetase (NDP forming)
MLVKEIISPNSIVVVGGSNNLRKTGGKVLYNLLKGTYKGRLYVLNPKETEVQGLKSYRSLEDLPGTELAILAIASSFCADTVRYLAEKKGTKGFIILSAGFAEEGKEGARLEQEIKVIIDKAGGSLIGPNCIGVLNPHYQGVFTTPVPASDSSGCDFISGSGATAVFIMEAAISLGLKFSSVYSVGNSAQVGIEDILEHMDETWDPDSSPKIKLLYIENIAKPGLLLKHASSLIRKGCKIAAIKAGTTEAGSRAASSHTGALASPDTAVDALLRKAGIVRCYSRSELVTVASVFMHRPLAGKNFAIITHAGGPAVMLTDALSEGGLSVPPIKDPRSSALLEKLHHGSSVANPIDFLATGNAEQLGIIIDYCEKYFEQIDGMIVIFGSPGLFPVNEVYSVLDEKMKTCNKPIFPVLPSIINARQEIDEFQGKGRINFPDEVALGKSLAKVYRTAQPVPGKTDFQEIDKTLIYPVINSSGNGYLPPEKVGMLLDAARIPRISEGIATNLKEALKIAGKTGFPLVMKVTGPLHKSDIGGVVLNIRNEEEVKEEFARMIKLPEVTGILIQYMSEGTELFAGIKYEPGFGSLIMCGLGGIFVEVIKDVQTGLAPLNFSEALEMIRNLRGYPVFKGVRGRTPVNEKLFAEILVKLSALADLAPEIKEMDINPLIGTEHHIVALDARVRISKDLS